MPRFVPDPEIQISFEHPSVDRLAGDGSHIIPWPGPRMSIRIEGLVEKVQPFADAISAIWEEMERLRRIAAEDP